VKEKVMKTLHNLTWSPKWVSHLGCIKGCLDYLGLEISDAWLYGGTGHAFIINISQDCCPSGPTAWRTMMLFQQGFALGYQLKVVFGSKYDQDLADLQKQAWEFTRESVDKGLPVYAWELAIPEFYVIYGYDDVGYYYAGPGADQGAGPKPWGELGDTGVGLVEVYSLELVEPETPEKVVKSAFERALKHAANPDEWILQNYAAGLKGFDNWVVGLESGTANRFGMGYNAAVWHECRTFAVEFLYEARRRLDGTASALFDDAIQHYQLVAARLGLLSERYPFIPEGGPDTIPVDDGSREAVAWLKEARQAEAKGLSTLEQIVAKL
jgi:hypothetical protein